MIKRKRKYIVKTKLFTYEFESLNKAIKKAQELDFNSKKEISIIFN